MNEWVLDASALIAVVQEEPGAELVLPRLTSSIISAVNRSEVLAKLVDFGLSLEEGEELVGRLSVGTVPFDVALADAAAGLRAATRHLGLSLGDRACLALARARRLPVLTTDRAWRELAIGIRIHVIR